MKKFLIATTALVATAGVAAAEVSLSGDARMGVVYDGSDAMFTSRARVSFNMSGETDGGLAFGASFRADNAAGSFSIDEDCIAAAADVDAALECASTGGGAAGGTMMNAGSVYISGAFGKLSMGDNDTAANALVGNVSGVGLTGLGDTNNLGYVGQTDTSVLYTFSTGAVSVALSAGQVGSDDFSAAVKYSTDQFSVALGYEDNGDTDQLTLGGSASFGAATVKAVVADNSDNSDKHYALSVDYAMGPGSVTVFYANRGDDGDDTWGIGGAYDLGGGAKVVGGVVDNGSDTVADFGISMSF